jgi:hypothetical protein
MRVAEHAASYGAPRKTVTLGPFVRVIATAVFNTEGTEATKTRRAYSEDHPERFSSEEAHTLCVSVSSVAMC